MKHNILFLSGWYPTRDNPTLGNFIVKHAECVSPHHSIYALHVSLTKNISQKEEVDFSETQFPSKVIYLRKSKVPILGSLFDKLKIIKRHFSEYNILIDNGFKPELIHANIAYPIGIVACMLKWKYKINYIIEEHWTGYLDYGINRPGFFKKRIIRFVANRSNAILPDSQDLGRAIQKLNIKTPIIKLANVVHVEHFTPQLQKEESEISKMIHVSTLHNVHKNIELLIDSFSEVLNLGHKAELHIISDGDFEQYKGKIEELGIAKNIIFYGELKAEEIAPVLREADFFVLSSNFENLPCVLIESVACGVPAISTNVGGVDEIINETNGILVEPRNKDQMVDAMIKMINSHHLYDKTEMHKSAVSLYSYEAIGKQLSEIYSDVIQKTLS